MIACLILGAADLAFIDAVVLPTVVRRAPVKHAPLTVRLPEPVKVIAAHIIQQPAPTVRSLELTLNFDTGQTALKLRARRQLDALALQAAAHPDWKISIEGHADARGDDELNERLSEARARQVARRLQAQELPARRLRTAAFGATKPLVDGTDRESLKRNRRVEIFIVRGEP